MTVFPDPPEPHDPAATGGWMQRGDDDAGSSAPWDDGGSDALEAPSSIPVEEPGDPPGVPGPGFDGPAVDAPLAAAGTSEPDDGGQEDDVLLALFAGDWVDPSVLPGEPGPEPDDDLPADAEVGAAARLLWHRVHPDAPPPADDVASILRAVAEAGLDELDQRAARVLLGLLDGPPV